MALSNPGDDVVLAQGNHHVAASAPDACTDPFTGVNPGDIGLRVSNRDVRGVDGRPRPRIISSPATCVTATVADGGRLHHLELDNTDTSATTPETYAMVIDGSATADDVITSSSGAQMRNGAHLFNSVLNTGYGNYALRSYFGSSYSTPGTSSYIRNVTARGKVAAERMFDSDVAIQCLNSVATGGFRVDTGDGSTSGQAHIALDHCMGSTSTDGYALDGFTGTAVAGSASLAADGFHELAGSATINAGIAASTLLKTDIDDGARVKGAAPDIGADEFGAGLPLVNSGYVGQVGATQATLHGAITPNGLPTGGFAQFGKTTSYGSKTGTVSVGSGLAPTSVGIKLTGLAPATRYHVRLVGTNGNVTGEDRTFKTTGG